MSQPRSLTILLVGMTTPPDFLLDILHNKEQGLLLNSDVQVRFFYFDTYRDLVAQNFTQAPDLIFYDTSTSALQALADFALLRSAFTRAWIIALLSQAVDTAFDAETFFAAGADQAISEDDLQRDNILQRIRGFLQYLPSHQPLVTLSDWQPEHWPTLFDTLLNIQADLAFILNSAQQVEFHHIPNEWRHILDAQKVHSHGLLKALPHGLTQQILQEVPALKTDQAIHTFEYDQTLPQGRLTWVVQLASIAQLPTEKKEQYLIVIRDISHSIQLQEQLRIAATAFETQNSTLILDVNQRITHVNAAFTHMMEYAANELLGTKAEFFDDDNHDASFISAVWQCAKHYGSWQGEVSLRKKNGDCTPTWLAISCVFDQYQNPQSFIFSCMDLSERKHAEKHIHHLSYYDALTHLPNRRLLTERLKHAQGAKRYQNDYGALLFIDLDHFKHLNDSLGHDMGDHLLMQVAHRLGQCTEHAHLIARIDGDEFALLLENLDPDHSTAIRRAKDLAQHILNTLDRPYLINEVAYHVTSSVGISLFIEPQETADDVFKRTDLAISRAKSSGRNNLCIFNPEMQTLAESRLMLENDLRHALKTQEFTLFYQPLIASDGKVTGAEALIRWFSIHQQPISPERFIPLAEETGMILSLGQWVLETACKQLHNWQTHPSTRHLSIAVNVSARQFRHAGFIDQVMAALKHSGANPSGLTLELTESLLLDNVDSAVTTMNSLRMQGIGFSLDDFGTGYSSLSYLKRLPLQHLKIDRSFVRDILLDRNDEAIARTILALGHTLDLVVIAEGVESVEQYQALAELGCEVLQGYLFGKPAPIDMFDYRIRKLQNH